MSFVPGSMFYVRSRAMTLARVGCITVIAIHDDNTLAELLLVACDGHTWVHRMNLGLLESELSRLNAVQVA
jgi:hypothetical protein